MRLTHYFILLFAFAGIQNLALANEFNAGFIKSVEGEAIIVKHSTAVPAQPGLAVHRGDVLKTGHNGRLGVTFIDNTRLSMGSETEIVIDDYLFKPAQGQIKLAINMLKETLQYISGVIAKLKPEAVSVKTPTSIIGVRGTRFLVKTEAD